MALLSTIDQQNVLSQKNIMCNPREEADRVSPCVIMQHIQRSTRGRPRKSFFLVLLLTLFSCTISLKQPQKNFPHSGTATFFTYKEKQLFNEYVFEATAILQPVEKDRTESVCVFPFSLKRLILVF